MQLLQLGCEVVMTGHHGNPVQLLQLGCEVVMTE